jgi:hypothetical protein
MVAGVVQVENFARAVGPVTIAQSPAGGTKALRIPVTAGPMDEVLVHLKFCNDPETSDLFNKRVQARFYFESSTRSAWGLRGFAMTPPVVSADFADQENMWRNFNALFGPVGTGGSTRESYVTKELMFDLEYSSSTQWEGTIWIDDIEIID